MDKIEIAKIVKEQGIKGDVKVIVFADDNFDFSCLKKVYVNNTCANVEKVYKLGNAYGVKLDIIDSRNTASLYKNAIIYANKEDIVIDNDRFFIVDLINKIAVLDNGDVIGKIVDIDNFGSADVFFIKNNNKQVLVSHIDGLIKCVQGQNVVLNSEKFKQVAVYED